MTEPRPWALPEQQGRLGKWGLDGLSFQEEGRARLHKLGDPLSSGRGFSVWVAKKSDTVPRALPAQGLVRGQEGVSIG